jgi:phage shock protein PspC (stress-responsive transcriptional regulator)
MVRAPAPRDLGGMPETPLPPDPETPGGDTPHAASDEQPTTQMPPGPEAPPPTRRLLRSRKDRVLGGVCGGVAEYFRIDPLIVRIAAVALAFIGGASIIAYVAALALVPNDDGTGRADRERPSRAGTLIGAALLVFAGIALLGDLGGGWGWGVAFGAIPCALIVGGLALAGQRLLRRRGDDQPSGTRIVGAAFLVLALILGAGIAAAGAAWATAAGAGEVVAALVIAIGVAMIALSFRHRNARWLAVPALVLAIPSGAVAAAGIDVHGGIGERTYRPASTVDLRPQGYRLGTGELVVDLRDMDWPDGAALNLKVKVGAGHALVLVPADVCVQSKAHVGLGYIDVLGDESGGADVDDERGSLLRRSDHRRLYIDANVGAGAYEVLHRRRGDFDGHDRGSINRTLADAGCAGARA